VAVWGDTYIHSTEEWDDYNTNNGDGCSENWMIEEGYVCFMDAVESACEKCERYNASPNEDKSQWVAVWGDHMKHADEEWETPILGEGTGCFDNWTIEEGYIWYRISSTSYAWEEWILTEKPNDAKDQWVSQWGDGLKHVNEQWDDGNTDDGDGWSFDWKIEHNSIWTVNTEGVISEWEVCGDGLTQKNNMCVIQCGDGRKHSLRRMRRWQSN